MIPIFHFYSFGLSRIPEQPHGSAFLCSHKDDEMREISQEGSEHEATYSNDLRTEDVLGPLADLIRISLA